MTFEEWQKADKALRAKYETPRETRNAEWNERQALEAQVRREYVIGTTDVLNGARPVIARVNGTMLVVEHDSGMRAEIAYELDYYALLRLAWVRSVVDAWKAGRLPALPPSGHVHLRAAPTLNGFVDTSPDPTTKKGT